MRVQEVGRNRSKSLPLTTRKVQQKMVVVMVCCHMSLSCCYHYSANEAEHSRGMIRYLKNKQLPQLKQQAQTGAGTTRTHTHISIVSPPPSSSSSAIKLHYREGEKLDCAMSEAAVCVVRGDCLFVCLSCAVAEAAAGRERRSKRRDGETPKRWLRRRKPQLSSFFSINEEEAQGRRRRRKEEKTETEG